MKNNIFLIALFLTFGMCQLAQTQDAGKTSPVFVANPQAVEGRLVRTLTIGADAPDFRLPGVDNRFYTLSDFKEAPVLVIIFTCNHCPTAQGYEERIKAVAADYQGKGVALVAISPNSPLGLRYEELGYTDLNDDYEAMKIRAAHRQFNFPYLYDGDTQAVSLQYGPMATPHAFVFDQSRKLRYTGRLDKDKAPDAKNAEELRAAIDAVLTGKPVAEPVTETFGCSTKWAWNAEKKEKVDQEWAARPVTLEKIDSVGVAALLKNEGTGKLRLINVWASWCGPCVLEYPDLVLLQRMYGARDFEFVSLSADKVEKEDKVLAFLKDKHSALTNYLFSEDDKYALIDAVGHDWHGALPFTILLEPGGNVVWQQEGELEDNLLALKRAIVEHRLMGRY